MASSRMDLNANGGYEFEKGADDDGQQEDDDDGAIWPGESPRPTHSASLNMLAFELFVVAGQQPVRAHSHCFEDRGAAE